MPFSANPRVMEVPLKVSLDEYQGIGGRYHISSSYRSSLSATMLQGTRHNTCGLLMTEAHAMAGPIPLPVSFMEILISQKLTHDAHLLESMIMII